MISAKSANFKSKHQKEINDMLNRFENEIQKAIDKGEFCCDCSISVDLKQPVRDEIKKIMLDYGYEIDMPDFKVYIGPSDQTPWIESVTIKWNNI